jgi:hypothetical protein
MRHNKINNKIVAILAAAISLSAPAGAVDLPATCYMCGKWSDDKIIDRHVSPDGLNYNISINT